MRTFLFNRVSHWKQYLFSISTIILVSAICFAFSALMGYRVVAFILLLTVSILAITFDILPVLVAATLSAFIWDFFFIPPRFTVHVDTTEDTILLIMYFVIALISGVLTYKIRKIEKAARIKEEKANSVKLYNTILDSLSHELRTPVAAIIGAADNLQLNSHLTDHNREQLISEISRASLRLNQQIENLLNISRLESGHIQPKSDWCDIQELIYDTVKSVEENSTGRIISINVSPQIPLCWIDKGLLHQIIYNLLNNAAIHTTSGTRIDISAMCHADILKLIIEDYDKGFNTKNTDEVFQKFSREQHANSHGSGLGLSIVKGFTEALDGKIELINKKSGGALFTLFFPVLTSQIKIDER